LCGDAAHCEFFFLFLFQSCSAWVLVSRGNVAMRLAVLRPLTSSTHHR
jgi:hypothetical protein